MVDVILLMWEYGADPPLWGRLSTKPGNADPQPFDLSDRLRSDLRAWNDGLDASDTTGDQVDAEVAATHRVASFDLAARVQIELGDDVHVWCAAGEGLGLFPSSAYGSPVVVSAETPGTTIDRWTANRAESLTVSAAGGGSATAKSIVGWRQLTQRVEPPFGNAATRSAGLRAAGALQRDLGATAQVCFFGGARGPADDVSTRRRW
jgi:hypothetical protein